MQLNHGPHATSRFVVSLLLSLVVLVGCAAEAGVYSEADAGEQLVPEHTKDNHPPQISIASPPSGATVGPSVIVSGSAADNTRVRQVDIAVDGRELQRASGTNAWTHALSGLVPGPHEVTARAVDDAGRTTSATVTFVVAIEEGDAAPSNLRVSNRTSTSVALAWDAACCNVKTYQVWRSEIGYSSWVMTGSIPSVTLVHNDTTVSPGTTYYYCARAAGPRRTLSDCSNLVRVDVPARTAPPSTTTRFFADIETGTFNQFGPGGTHTNGTSLTISDENAFDGEYSARASALTSYARAQWREQSVQRDGSDFWYGMAIYLPAGFYDTLGAYVTVMQWDNYGYDGMTHDGVSRTSVIIDGADGKARLVSEKLGSGEETALSPAFDIAEDQWSWLEVHQRLDRIDGRALNEVYVDGVRVGRTSSQNTYGDPLTSVRYGIVALPNEQAARGPITLWFDRAFVSTTRITSW